MRGWQFVWVLNVAFVLVAQGEDLRERFALPKSAWVSSTQVTSKDGKSVAFAVVHPSTEVLGVTIPVRMELRVYRVDGDRPVLRGLLPRPVGEPVAFDRSGAFLVFDSEFRLWDVKKTVRYDAWLIEDGATFPIFEGKWESETFEKAFERRYGSRAFVAGDGRLADAILGGDDRAAATAIADVVVLGLRRQEVRAYLSEHRKRLSAFVEPAVAMAWIASLRDDAFAVRERAEMALARSFRAYWPTEVYQWLEPALREAAFHSEDAEQKTRAQGLHRRLRTQVAPPKVLERRLLAIPE